MDLYLKTDKRRVNWKMDLVMALFLRKSIKSLFIQALTVDPYSEGHTQLYT